MRWQQKKWKEGDTWYYNRKVFLFFPKTIGEETRWLEWAEWQEVWAETKSIDPIEWQPIKWLNK
jgi:hypothetical protein